MPKLYQDTYRRSLLDMHIPDWDPAFLSRYDPRALAEQYSDAGVDGVLVYCKSHMGLSYWPTPTGGIHAAARDRDLVGELLGELRARGIRPAAYHSVIYDNWAAENHPDWRVVSASTLLGEPNRTALGRRYGTLCPNNPAYLAYEVAQISALLERYDFDALWVDMVFWTAVCVCEHCRKKLRAEEGLELPTTVDWRSSEWTRFAAARERWLGEFWSTVRGAARAVRPGIAITHNFSTTIGSWYSASTTTQSADDTFTGGDLYGGRDEQLVVSKLMHSVSRHQPAEYMTSRTPDLRYHVQLRGEREILVQALGATAMHLAFLFIDAIDPIGTVEPGVYEQMGRVFARTAPFEAALGGRPVEDVALYYSDNAKMAWEDDGHHISEPPTPRRPHQAALFRACRTLQEGHIPFGIITRSQLGRLGDFAVVVLPDVLRMDDEETSAVREYVRAGGRVYASGRASEADTRGHRGDFALGDVFGAEAAERYEGGVIFVKSAGDLLEGAVQPERYVSWGLSATVDARELAPVDPLDLRFVRLTGPSARALGTVTLPYGYPDAGSLEGHGFASIHSSPPWHDTGEPAVVANDFGAGRSLYSLAPIESSSDGASTRLFTALITDLLGEDRRMWATAPAQVWITLFDQLDASRMVLGILNYDEHQEGLTATVSVRVAPPAGFRVSAVTDAITGEPAPFAIDTSGRAATMGLAVELFAQYLCALEPV